MGAKGEDKIGKKGSTILKREGKAYTEKGPLERIRGTCFVPALKSFLSWMAVVRA